MSVLLFEVKNHIAYITMNRPEIKNAYNHEMQMELHNAWEEVRDNPDIHLAILTGAGEHFSTGADMKQYFNPSVDDDVAQRRSFYSPFKHPHRTIHNSWWDEIYKPLIAAIHGDCRSGGVSMASACDIRVCTEDTVFAAAFVRAGLVSGGVGVRLRRTLPDSIAWELLLTGRNFTAEEAGRWGFVSRVVPKGEDMAAAEEIAHQILLNKPEAVQTVKEVALRGRELHLQEAIRIGRQALARRIYSDQGKQWREEFAKGEHRYTKHPSDH